MVAKWCQKVSKVIPRVLKWHQKGTKMRPKVPTKWQNCAQSAEIWWRTDTKSWKKSFPMGDLPLSLYNHIYIYIYTCRGRGEPESATKNYIAILSRTKTKTNYKYSIINEKKQTKQTHQHQQLIRQGKQRHCPNKLRHLSKKSSTWGPGRLF